MIGAHVFNHPNVSPRVKQQYLKMLKSLVTHGEYEGEIIDQHKNGDDLPIWIHVNGIADDKNRTTHYIGIMSDLTQRKKDEQRLSYLSNYDALTDLPNRNLFKSRLHQLILNSASTKEQFALLRINIDRFRLLNDSLGADGADDVEDDVFGRHAARPLAVDRDAEGLGLRLHEALCGKHVLDFARADAEGERAECAVRAGVAVAANNRHPRLRQSQLRADDVNDALLWRVNVEERNAELAAILAKRLNLFRRDRVADGKTAIRRRHIMIRRRHRQIRSPHAATCFPQSVERLRRRDFVNEMQINVEKRRRTIARAGDVVVPEFIEKCLLHSGQWSV